jgi:hypothetical protein
MVLNLSLTMLKIKLEKYAPALDNYGQSCFVRSDFLKTRGSQEPVIAHLVFNLTSKVDRKWGCYT